MSAVVTDTHAAIWYLSKSPRLSADARAAINDAAQAGEPTYLCSISLVEVAYLIEKGKLRATTFDLLVQALADPMGSFVIAPLDLAVAQTLRMIPRHIVPDMPDRIIAATALYLNLPLVTRDPQIKNIGSLQTIW